MFICSCMVLSIFMTITLVLFIKKEYDFFALMLMPTILTIIFTVLLIPLIIPEVTVLWNSTPIGFPIA